MTNPSARYPGHGRAVNRIRRRARARYPLPVDRGRARPAGWRTRPPASSTPGKSSPQQEPANGIPAFPTGRTGHQLVRQFLTPPGSTAADGPGASRGCADRRSGIVRRIGACHGADPCRFPPTTAQLHGGQLAWSSIDRIPVARRPGEARKRPGSSRKTGSRLCPLVAAALGWYPSFDKQSADGRVYPASAMYWTASSDLSNTPP
jgi:hypothetical protein